MSLEDRVLAVEKSVSDVGKGLAVHLSDCMALHKALDLKLGEVDKKVDSLGQKMDAHKTQTATDLKRMEKLILAVGAVLLLATAIGPQEAVKFLVSLVK